MSKKVNEFISEIGTAFGGEMMAPFEHLLTEYNRIVRELLLMLPTSDATLSASAVDGKIECALLPRQIKRVFLGESEFLSGSRELISLLPEANLFCAAEDGIFVTRDGEYTVFYREIPEELSSGDTLSATVPRDADFELLVRAYLEKCAFFCFGDYESADACAAEYNSRLEDYKQKNGVRV